MLEKDKELWKEILQIYKNMPFLWDKNDSNYLNRGMRQTGFESILELYKIFDEEATVTSLKKKIENMRTTYNRELKKVKASTQAGSDDVYTSKLWYFDMFGFLEERGRDILEDSDKDNGETSPPAKQLNKKPKAPITIKILTKSLRKKLLRKQDKIGKTSSKLLTSKGKVINTSDKSKTAKEEDWEVIGKSIGVQLKDLDKRQLTIAQKLISDTIFYGKTGKLSEESSINLRTPTIPSTSSSEYQNCSSPPISKRIKIEE